jgi:riboflavin biosynthesis pyrimidine reductase
MIAGVSGLALSSGVTNEEELAQSYGPWSGIRTNHVVSQSGSFFDESGSSRGLSTAEDLKLLLALRKQADLVIVDAATARNEQYRKLSTTQLAIVSSTGNFESIPATSASSGVTLFSPAEPIVSGAFALEHVVIEEANPLAALVEWASKGELDALLLEAGPTLTRIAFDASVVRQSAITITPQVSLESLIPQWNPFSSKGKLVSLAESTDASFSLWSY